MRIVSEDLSIYMRNNHFNMADGVLDFKILVLFKKSHLYLIFRSKPRNGTCFTSTECNEKGGTVSGNCAAG